MLKLVVCIIILAAICCAQEHFTCVKTNDRQINLLQDQFNSLSQELEGLKNVCREIQQQQQLNQHSQEIKDLETPSGKLYMLADNTWFLLPTAYAYTVTPGYLTWQESQEFCRNWGGTLAIHGVKTLENRKKLIEYLSLDNFYFWIGANDIASEGNWVWVNGQSASSSELIWSSGEPNSYGGDEDCVSVSAFLTLPDVGQAYDNGCEYINRRGLCEKEV